MEEIVFDEIDKLRQLRETHIEMGNFIISAHGGDIYPFDFLAVATLNRSMCLLKGFCDLMVKKNFIAAAPLIRMQLDNWIRFSAGWLVPKPHEFAIEIFEGKHVRNLTDNDGKRMTDRYLVKKLAEEDPWLLTLYEGTSGYIHLSNKHMFNAMQTADEDGILNMKITDQDVFVPFSQYLEAIRAFRTVTDKLFEYMHGWGVTKDNPEITLSHRGNE